MFEEEAQHERRITKFESVRLFTDRSHIENLAAIVLHTPLNVFYHAEGNVTIQTVARLR